jgi:hypothetical protein
MDERTGHAKGVGGRSLGVASVGGVGGHFEVRIGEAEADFWSG